MKNRDNYKKSQLNCLISLRFVSLLIMIILIFTGYLSLFIPTATAEGLDAEFYSLDVTATPRIQGMGGEIIINIKANFFGGCCYHLYAYDVKGEINVPENVNISSPEPDEVDEIDAKPGGVPTTANFKWRVTSIIPGDYEINVTVTTRNCGSIIDSFSIKFTEGASISNPKVYPHHPSVNEDVIISVEAKIGREDVEIEDLTLFTYTAEEEYNLEEVSAKLDTIYITKDSDKDGSEDHTVTIGLKGKSIPMEPVNFTNEWRVTSSGFSKESEVYYWFVVKTSDGKNTTSGIYHLKIEDLEKRDFIINSVVWSTVLGLLIGITLIFASWLYLLKRVDTPKEKKGFLALGGKYYKDPYHSTTPELVKLQKHQNMERNILLIFLIIIGVVLIIWAIYSNLFSDLFTKTLEG